MRYFNQIGYQEIAEECFNLEAGKRYFENGVLSDETNPSAHPLFYKNGVRTTFRSNLGMIVLPADEIVNFAGVFPTILEKLEKEFQQKKGASHFDSSTVLETGSEHFMLCKSKITFSENFTFLKRRIIVNQQMDKIERYVGTARFVWLVYSLHDFILDLNHYEARYIPFLIQLFGIIYDPAKKLNLQNGEFRFKNITFRDFHISHGILNVSLYGAMDAEFFTKKHIHPGAKYFQKYLNYPENEFAFLPSTRLTFSLSRKGAFNLILLHAPPTMYPLSTRHQVHPIEQPIFDLPFEKVFLENHEKEGCCLQCSTPLYGNIYVLGRAENRYHCGRAYCPTCLHSRFFANNSMSLGQPLYTTADKIVRTFYPRRVEEIIDQLLIDNETKKIMKLLFGEVIVEDTERGQMIWLASDGENYLGISFKLADFINLLDDPIFAANPRFSQPYHVFGINWMID